MIHDLAESTRADLPEYDVCVVGSGPAGATVVGELAGSGLRVCVLESGRLRPSRLGDELRRVESDGIVIKDHSRERVLGGASTTWNGLSSPLDEIDLEARPWMRYSGWPLEAGELRRWWHAAATRYRFPALSLYGSEGFGALRPRGEVSLSWKVLDEKIFLASSDPLDFGRERRSIYQGPDIDLFVDATVVRLKSAPRRADGPQRVVSARIRTRRGDSFRLRARIFVLACGGIENARLLLQSTDLSEAGLGNEHGQVGRYLMNHPKNYFGVIRLATKIHRLPYYFGCLYKGYAGYAGLRLREDVQRNLGVLNCYVRFEPLFPWSDNRGVAALVRSVKASKGFFRRWKEKRRDEVVPLRDYSETGDDEDHMSQRRTRLIDWRDMFSIVLNLPMVLRFAVSRLTRGRGPSIGRVRLRNFMEMEPHPENRVVLGDRVDAYGERVPLVRHSPTELDRRSLLALHEVLTSELRESGFGELDSDLKRAQPWPIDMDASHHMGTTRMGVDPSTSVVDPELRLHSVENVFVAGTSVFPTSGCANPTFTAVALSIRLAAHLRERLGGPPREDVEAAAARRRAADASRD